VLPEKCKPASKNPETIATPITPEDDVRRVRFSPTAFVDHRRTET
jgi:hypothetical protein